MIPFPSRMRAALNLARHIVRTRRPSPAAQAGFSLIEMLVVLVIIGLLVGLVGPRLLGNVDRGKATTAEAQVRMLKGALETMRLDLGRFPTAEEGLEVLVTPPRDSAIANRWMGPYLDGSIPLDPWGRAYAYPGADASNQTVYLYSLGADGRPGGSGVDADIGSIPPGS